MAEGATPTNDAHGREEDTLVKDPPPSSSTKSRGKAIQAYEEEHGGAASSTKLIPKANTDEMKRIDMDDSLKSMPVPKINQPPKILSNLNDTRDHSPSRDEDRDHDPRASNCGLDYNTHTGESSITRSTGVIRDGRTSPCAAALAKGTAPKSKSLGKAVQDGITSPRAAELAKGTAETSSSIKSVIPDDPSIEENVNSPLSGPSSSTLSPTKAVENAPGSEEHMLAVPPSSSTKSRGKAIEASSYRVIDGYLVKPAYDQEHDEEASSTKIIPKAFADAGPSVRAPAQHHDGVGATIGDLAQANAGDVASNTASAILAVVQHDVNGEIPVIGGVGSARLAPVQPNAARQVPASAQINGGGNAVIAVRPAPAQPNVPRQVPAPAQINGRGIAVIAARPAPAQPNAGGPAPNVAPPVPVLPPNPGLNNIDEVLMNSGIRPLRNPADGDKGKLWDKLN